jgi:hypothetical protein
MWWNKETDKEVLDKKIPRRARRKMTLYLSTSRGVWHQQSKTKTQLGRFEIRSSG